MFEKSRVIQFPISISKVPMGGTFFSRAIADGGQLEAEKTKGRGRSVRTFEPCTTMMVKQFKLLLPATHLPNTLNELRNYHTDTDTSRGIMGKLLKKR